MKIRGFYELELDDRQLLETFKENLPNMTPLMPDGVARGVAGALANVACVKDVKVTPIPLMLVSDQVQG